MAEKTQDPVKITNQFRSRTGFVYDLKCEDARVTINIAQRQNAADAGEWRVEVRLSSAPEVAPVEAWSATRSEALREVGRLWASRGPDSPAPRLDWDAIAKALSAVRAL